MKNAYNIRLHRTHLFRIICFLLLIFTAVQLVLPIYDLIHYGFNDYFFGNTNDPFIGGMAYPLGVTYIFQYVLTVLLDVFFLYILFLGTFMNKIKVRQNDILLFFAPCIFYRIYKANIHSIEPVAYSSLSVTDKIFSFNFSKESLYRITCYDTDFVICSKDSGGMQKLMAEINPMGNPRECDEEDFDPKKFTKREKIIIVTVAVVLLDIVQNIYYFFI